MYVQTVGTRAQVWHGTARKTSGGLMKNDLMKNKAGRIVSKAKHNTAKKEMRLVKYGYGTKKGEFGMVKIGSRKRKSKGRKSKKMRGGYADFSPANVNDSYMISDVVPQEFSPQDRALQAGGKSRRMRGGYANFSPANVNDSYMIKDVVPQVFSPLDRALQAGGRRRSRSRSQRRSQRGGTGMKSLSPSDLGSDDVQFMAGNAA